MITGFIPFILHHYNKSTKIRALEGISGCKWDATTGAVITPNDKVVQDGLTSDYWWQQDNLRSVKEQESTEPTHPVGQNFATAT
jgi:hypothetical protein